MGKQDQEHNERMAALEKATRIIEAAFGPPQIGAPYNNTGKEDVLFLGGNFRQPRAEVKKRASEDDDDYEIHSFLSVKGSREQLAEFFIIALEKRGEELLAPIAKALLYHLRNDLKPKMKRKLSNILSAKITAMEVGLEADEVIKTLKEKFGHDVFGVTVKKTGHNFTKGQIIETLQKAFREFKTTQVTPTPDKEDSDSQAPSASSN